MSNGGRSDGEPCGFSSKQRRRIPYEPAGSNLDTDCVMNRHCLKLRMFDEYTESCFVYAFIV
jgi:hypothetical protein